MRTYFIKQENNLFVWVLGQDPLLYFLASAANRVTCVQHQQDYVCFLSNLLHPLKRLLFRTY